MGYAKFAQAIGEVVIGVLAAHVAVEGVKKGCAAVEGFNAKREAARVQAARATVKKADQKAKAWF